MKSVSRQDLVDQRQKRIEFRARSLIGQPYARRNVTSKSMGYDCVQLIVESFAASNIYIKIDKNLNRHSKLCEIEKIIFLNGFCRVENVLHLNDIILKYENSGAHFSILSKFGSIEANYSLKKIVERPLCIHNQNTYIWRHENLN
jgi:hypothetical protein